MSVTVRGSQWCGRGVHRICMCIFMWPCCRTLGYCYVVEISIWHTHTHTHTHTHRGRCLHDKQKQETNVNALGGIRTRNPSKLVAAYTLLRSLGDGGRLYLYTKVSILWRVAVRFCVTGTISIWCVPACRTHTTAHGVRFLDNVLYWCILPDT